MLIQSKRHLSHLIPRIKWCMNRRQFKDPLTNTCAGFGQLDEHQTGVVEVPSSMLTGGNILLLNFWFSHSKGTHVDIANSVGS